MSDRKPMVERLTEVSRVLPLDTLGHLLCTYDETGDCECSTLPERLAAHDEAIRAEERERVAVAIEEVEELCEVMHDAYESAAVESGWETQKRSRKPWADVPDANKATMRVAVLALLRAILNGIKPTCHTCNGSRFLNLETDEPVPARRLDVEPTCFVKVCPTCIARTTEEGA